MSLPNFCCKSFSKISKLPKTIKSLKCAPLNRTYSSDSHGPIKVTVVGAAGRVGEALCLMLKQSPLIDILAPYDVAGVCGLGMELGHIDTKSKVTPYSEVSNIQPALEHSTIVVIVAAAQGTAYSPYSAMFEANANIIQSVVQNFTLYCPNALLAISTHPVNCMVPLASEIIKTSGHYNHKRVFGVTTLDSVRANSFVAKVQGLDPEAVLVPVIGGNQDKTIVPILSQAQPCADFTNDELEKITKQIQTAHHDVIREKIREGSTFSGAFATAKFVLSLVKAVLGCNDIIESAYVRSKEHPNCKYLATPLVLGPGGIEKNLGIPQLTAYEECLLESAVPLITGDVKKGELFAGVVDPPPCDLCDPNPLAPPCPPDWCAKQEVERLDA